LTTRVLLVDDEKINLVVTQKRLETRGFEVDTTSNGLQAVKQCADERYDVILMDLSMPKMDGIEASILIRSSDDSLNRDTPIIAYTAHIHDDIKDQCASADIDDILIKPVLTPQLIEKVESWAKRNR
jgi:CheY-like chemotaxis protein